MSPAERLRILDRLRSSWRAIRGLESRSIPVVDTTFVYGQGMPALFKPHESPHAFGDNVYLYRRVLTIAMEMASIVLKLRTKDSQKAIERHQALVTLNFPNPARTAKAILTSMTLCLVTGKHLTESGRRLLSLAVQLYLQNSPELLAA